jgi:signal transduction histidine kinase
MRRRLFVFGALGLLTLLLIVEVPFALAAARWNSDRWADEERTLAAAAAVELSSAAAIGMKATVGEELVRFATGGRLLVVVDDRGQLIAQTSNTLGLLRTSQLESLRRAANSRPVAKPNLDILLSHSLFSVHTIFDGDRSVGAVGVLSPPTKIRRNILRFWALLMIGGFTILALGVLVCFPATSWILRPVADLEQAALRIRGGERARVATSTGPPELRRLGEGFNDMANEVQDALEREHAFVADASHQLRNPITSLLLRVENLTPHVQPDGEVALAKTRREVERMAAIIEQLLALARVDGGGTPPEVMDLGGVVRLAVDSWNERLASSHGTIAVTLSSGVLVRCRPGTIEQVLDVLLDNALKFSPDSCAVSVHVRDGSDGPALHVLDEGPSLSLDDARRAADRFWRGPGQQHRPGVGLGLAIAHRLLTNDGGSLQLRPRPEGGLDAVALFGRR